jgi:6-phosphogluconolactonase
MTDFIRYSDREIMMLDLANILAGDLKMFLQTHEKVSFCVPGGTTPGPVFDSLSGVPMDWARVAVFLNDERWVPETSSRSNTALLRARLLQAHAAAATLVPLYAPTEQPEESLADLTAGLRPHLPISVLLLGMGADMHTASLFPGADQLQQALAPDAPPLLAMRAPGAPEPRITLSARVLADAMQTHIVITGQAKREAFERARNLPPEKAPVAAVLANATVHWAA